MYLDKRSKMMANIHLAGMEEDLYSGYDKEDMAPQLNTEDLGNHTSLFSFYFHLGCL